MNNVFELVSNVNFNIIFLDDIFAWSLRNLFAGYISWKRKELTVIHRHRSFSLKNSTFSQEKRGPVERKKENPR